MAVEINLIPKGLIMKSDEGIKGLVKEKYGQIAKQASSEGCGCGSQKSCCSGYGVASEDYTQLAGYNPNADLHLGCGIPTEVAQIKAGDVVVDLGSGAGNDAFVARALVGETGKVIGIDMTEEMVNKARGNATNLKYANVEFRLGEIEKIPIVDDTADVVISNCVLNLVPSKQNAFSEIFRILKSGGHFSISDVVLTQRLPDSAKSAVELYSQCVSGALLKEEYLAIINETGFKNVRVAIEKPKPVPEDLLQQSLTVEELQALDRRKPLALSITVYAEKP